MFLKFKKKENKKKCIATHIDRDFQFGGYGTGKPRFYVNENFFAEITPIPFVNGVLTVRDEWVIHSI